MAHLVALRYKSEARGCDSRLCHWDFLLTEFFRPHYGPGVDSASNRNEYQEYFLGGKGGRCVELTSLPTSCANWHEIWDPHPPGTIRVCLGLLQGLLAIPLLFYKVTETRRSVVC